MSKMDSIIALATPPGRSGIGILRISGSLAITVARVVLGRLPRQRQAEYLPFRDADGTILDQGIAIFFPAPGSFTGEDVLELHGHGGPVILDLLLQRILSLPGIRIARPGEFSERAFLNNKLDLSQAEAISDLIEACSLQAARAAVNSLQGVFSKHIHELVAALTKLRIHLEAAIDFSNEEIEFFSNGKIEASLNEVMFRLDEVRSKARQGSLLREGIKIVIAGKPNVGKSSLLNSLAGREVAIVTPIAGTTRDVLRENIQLDGIPLHIIDTAGLHATSNEVEKIGIERAWREIEQADHVLLIMDATLHSIDEPNIMWQSFMTRLSPEMRITVIRNKADLTGEMIGIQNINGYSLITLSAKSGIGIEFLRAHLKESVGFIENTEGSFLARRRHLGSLETAATHLYQGKKNFMNTYSGELLAEDLRLAQQALSEITGEVSSRDLLSGIFSTFCIGK